MSQNGKRDIVAVIPSRYASSRFEGKPLAEISGKPMIQRVYEQARKNRTVRDVVVATDDPRIAGAVEAFGGRVVMTSPAHRSGTDRTAEAAEILGLRGKDIVMNIQGDQPLIHPESLSEVAAPLMKDPDLSMATLAFAIVDPRERTDPKDVKVVFDTQGFALYFSRSRIPFPRDPGKDPPVYKHLGVYAYTVDFLKRFQSLPEGALERIEKLEQLRALEHGYEIKVVITDHDSPEVDLPVDIPRIEARIRN
ncbi:MAG: 3-deoxy-manno-octulosonate cytidylyltransferase [Deltaproteobacteria bacterium]|nr:3-deoxy-manno-octulosonate cytidylyltransferase [Deltaproteobacteria bacterium]